jgi:hypothetical protein
LSADTESETKVPNYAPIDGIVALELPQTDQPLLDKFFASQPPDLSLLHSSFWLKDYQDGRTSIAMADLIARLKDWHYGDIFIIDTSGVDIAGRTDYCERSESCWAEGVGYSIETWRSRVRRADATEGRVRDPIRYLDGVLRSD